MICIDAGAAAAGRSKNNFKSKVRRLYDIANVLASLQLIEKIHITQSRRPAFKWCGAEVFPLESSVAGMPLLALAACTFAYQSIAMI